MMDDQFFGFAAGFDTSKTLFVGDLSYFCTEEDLFALFVPFGNILTVRVRRGVTGESLMHGFVAMEHAESATSAIASLDRVEFMGRNIRVQLSSDGQRSEINKDSLVQVHASFISKQNTFLVTEKVLRDIFQSFGVVADVAIKKHINVPGRQSGYGFIYFNEATGAYRAVEALKQNSMCEVILDCSISHKSENMIRQQLHGKRLSAVANGTNPTFQSYQQHPYQQQKQQLMLQQQKQQQQQQQQQQQLMLQQQQQQQLMLQQQQQGYPRGYTHPVTLQNQAIDRVRTGYAGNQPSFHGPASQSRQVQYHSAPFAEVNRQLPPTSATGYAVSSREYPAGGSSGILHPAQVPAYMFQQENSSQVRREHVHSAHFPAALEYQVNVDSMNTDMDRFLATQLQSPSFDMSSLSQLTTRSGSLSSVPSFHANTPVPVKKDTTTVLELPAQQLLVSTRSSFTDMSGSDVMTARLSDLTFPQPRNWPSSLDFYPPEYHDRQGNAFGDSTPVGPLASLSSSRSDVDTMLPMIVPEAVPSLPSAQYLLSARSDDTDVSGPSLFTSPALQSVAQSGEDIFHEMKAQRLHLLHQRQQQMERMSRDAFVVLEDGRAGDDLPLSARTR